jgi:D-glycero-D-manno-heptose 1,7-bisphosphate phosphatase
MGIGRAQVARPAVFLDRDGTLNIPGVRNGKPFPPEALDDFRLFADAPGGCRKLKAVGFALVVATNQPDVGRGTLSQSVVEAMHERLRSLVPEIDRIEVSYDSGKEPARRRKPEPGMLLDAAAALNLDLARSWMVGDRWRDVECGRRAGVRTVLIDFGYAERLPAPPDFTVKSFGEAVEVILGARPDAQFHLAPYERPNIYAGSKDPTSK